MARDSGLRGDAAELRGRRSECATLDRLMVAVRSGNSQALVMRGEAGVGKTALLDYLTRQASGCQVVRVAGVQSEMELAFAGLHQLCTSLLDYAGRLPGPQREALRTALGLSTGPAPDRFLVGLAVLGLLSEAARERPLVCAIDDLQWLDRASVQALGFVARRLAAGRVGLVFAARSPSDDVTGIPELMVAGLHKDDALGLLDSVLAGPVDERVRDQLVSETGGNPLALLELPRGLTPAQLAGGFGLMGAQAIPVRIEQGFQQRLAALPADTRSLMLVAAAEPVGNPVQVWRAARRLGIPAAASVAAQTNGLLEIGTRVRFRHPLVRSAVYSAASPQERQAVHQALAEVTDRDQDPDRRAWHLAAAASGPDEQVAAELEQSAGRAQARGGMAAAAAFLQRAVELTAEAGQRAERLLAAAQASLQAGAFDAAAEQLAIATAEPLDELQQARAALLRGRLVFAASAGNDASELLVKAAKRLESLDVALARQTYLEAWAAAYHAGRSAGPGSLREVARAARSAPLPEGVPRPSDLLLDGLAVLVIEGRAHAASLLRRTARVFAQDEIAVEEGLRWGWLATIAAIMVWDEEYWDTMVARQLQACREAGLLTPLLIYVNAMAQLLVWRGDFAEATSLIAEARSITAATGTRFVPYAALMLAGFRGTEAEATELIESVAADARAAGQGHGIQASHRVSATLYNGLGRYETARTEAQLAAEEAPELFSAMWALPELIEAASRSGQAALAVEALGRLAEATSAGQTNLGQGIYARCRALVSDGADAEGWYREATARLSRTGIRTELARAHLLYGEWLRRAGRRADARAQLRTATDIFDAIGMEAFAERARSELLATGETARKRTAGTRDQLTPQEAQIARLARAGMSNPEIAAQLFLSARTVEWHLRKVFTKLDISSRRQLQRALPDGPMALLAVGPAAPPAGELARVRPIGQRSGGGGA
jgi:DNA-binding CsgD family transcriptional regulator